MEGEKCLYMTVYTTLQKKIRSGEIRSGEKLPAEKVLAEEFGVSRITIQKAMGMLVQDGYIVRRPGRGSFACLDEGKQTAEALEEGDPGRHSHIIGLVMEDFSAGFGIELLKAVIEEADRRGYYLCVERSCGDQKREKEILESLLRLKVDGLIVMPTHGQHYNTEILKMVGEGMPVVFIDRYLEGLPVPFVGTDNRRAIAELMKNLLRRGYRRLAFFTAPETDAASLQERIEGYQSMCRMLEAEEGEEGREFAGYMLDSIRSTIPDQKSSQNTSDDAERIERFLREHRDVEAVIAAEYDIAVLTEMVCRKMGIRVPEDMAVTCFDGPLSTYGDYRYTHVRQNEEMIGRKAVEILLRLIGGEKITDRIYVDARIVSGRGEEKRRGSARILMKT